MARKPKSTKKNNVPPFTAENLFKAASKGLNADFEKIRETMSSDSIAAAIEIKSNLNKTELKDAAEKIANIKKLKEASERNHSRNKGAYQCR